MSNKKAIYLVASFTTSDGVTKEEKRELSVTTAGFDAGQTTGYMLGFAEGVLSCGDCKEVVIAPFSEGEISNYTFAKVHNLLESTVEVANGQPGLASGIMVGYSFDSVHCTIKAIVIGKEVN